MNRRNDHSRQRRAMFFVFDGGTGLGHLRRLSSIAKALQGDFACLIVTSHRAAAHWFVPEECEYIHLPAWDSLLPEKAAYWGREPFLSDGPEAALDLRRALLRGIVDAFRPDAIFVDHLPLGMRCELEDIIANTDCRKYLVTRGVQNETEDLDRLLLKGAALDSIKRWYDHVFVCIDRQIFDLKGRYESLEAVADKLSYVGYIVQPVADDVTAKKRSEYGLRTDDVWVVASAGGGQHGEALIVECCRLASTFPKVTFDVVSGPRSQLSSKSLTNLLAKQANLRVHQGLTDMFEIHAAADIVISSGGYNSLLETLQGHAQIICVPSRKSYRDEQYVHADALRKFATVFVDTDVANLRSMLTRALESGGLPDRRRELDFGGANAIRRFVLSEMGLENRPVSGA